MRHHDRLVSPNQRLVTYEWRYTGRWNRLGLQVSGSPYIVEETAEESFITEHYWGYGRQRDGSTLEYQVEHPRWRVWRASGAELDCDVASLYGPEFVEFLSGSPHSAFLAEGSEVIVRKGRRLL